MIHRYDYLTENEDNLRASFKEGAPDVSQNAAQEPIFYYSERVHIRGPFKDNWANGESLRPNRFCTRSPRDLQIFRTNSAGLGIY